MTDSELISPRRRRKRRFLKIVAVLAAAGLTSFLWMRWRDRNAWPAPVADVRLPPLPAPVAGTSNAWDALKRLDETNTTATAKADEFLAELRRFEAVGLATNAVYPLLDAWVSSQTNALTAWSKAAAAESASVSVQDARELMPVFLRVVEIARISAYRTALALRDGDWDLAVRLWTDALRVARHVAEGQGIVGHFIALNVELAVCRDILVTATERDIPGAAAVALSDALLAAEAALTPLAEAVRHDRTLSHLALASIYTPRTREMPRDEANRHPPPHALWIARRLGSSPAVSSNHLDAVCSHVIAAAERPYSSDGLLASLPRWCRFETRAPWTRDPVGALVSTVFIRNVASAAAYPPHRRAEMRAARLALSLNQARQSDPERRWPVTTPQSDADASRDPFAALGASFVYRSDGASWTFHSVGMDQRDDGGTNDLFAASAKTATSDIIYTSAERERRAQAWRSSAAAAPAQRTIEP